MTKRRLHLMGSLLLMGLLSSCFQSFSLAGLNKFTELDQFDDWLIERKFDSKNDRFVCRASMPKYGSWFDARIRLDQDQNLVIPEELRVFSLPRTFPIAKLKKSLNECHESLIYFPQD